MSCGCHNLFCGQHFMSCGLLFSTGHEMLSTGHHPQDILTGSYQILWKNKTCLVDTSRGCHHMSCGEQQTLCCPQDIKMLSTGHVHSTGLTYPVDDIVHVPHRIHSTRLKSLHRTSPTRHTFYILWVNPVDNIFMSCGEHM